MKRQEKIGVEIMKELRSIALVMACLVFSFIAYSQAPAEVYKNANQLYKAGQFQQAGAEYEKIIAQGYRSADVYYNLGNCYYKQDNTGKAILNYERAVKLSPDDEDMQHNLRMANLKIIDKILPVPQMGIVTKWNNLVASNSSRGWGWIAVISIWLTLVVFAAYIFLGFKRVLMNVGVVLFIISFSCVLLAFKQSAKEEDSDAAILTVTNTNAKSAPDVNGSDLFVLHEGIKFTLLDQVGPWEKIRLADGKVGWVEKTTFEKI